MAVSFISSEPRVSRINLHSLNALKPDIRIKNIIHLNEGKFLIKGDDNKLYTNYFPQENAVITCHSTIEYKPLFEALINLKTITRKDLVNHKASITRISLRDSMHQVISEAVNTLKKFKVELTAKQKSSLKKEVDRKLK